jgi:hypothetical protein
MIVEVEPAGERDLRPGRQHHFGLGPTLSREEVATVDHRGGECSMVHQRSRAGAPGCVGVRFELFGSLIAEELYAVAALDERDAFGR